MATTVAEIAAAAFTKVNSKISGVIKACTITRTTQGEYDPSTGSYSTTTSTDTGRAVFDTKTKIEDALPGYVAGPTEKLVWIEGLDTITSVENDTIVIGGSNYVIKAVGDVAGAGAFFAATVIDT